MEENTKQKRGFALMDPSALKLISSLGGKAAHAVGTAHKFTAEEARAAGKKGGVAPHVSRGRKFSKRIEDPIPAATADTAAE